MSTFDMEWGAMPSSGEKSNVDFIKLASGDNKMRVVGKPSMINLHWENDLTGKNKKVICPGAGCPICKAGKAPQTRYQVQIIDRVDGKVKVLEQGTQVFNAIKAYAMDEEYGDPTKYDINIKKSGSGRDTKYTVMASPNKRPLTDDEQKAVSECKSLSEINKAKTIDEILQMGLQIFESSVSSLVDAEDTDIEISQDEWDSI